ncbi:MAG: reverse transcriptase domain-containing protein [Gammaproteobacteria bacterium]
MDIYQYFFDKNALYKAEFKNKGYIHFDHEFSLNRVFKALAKLKDTKLISHAFYPFIRFTIPKYKRDENGKSYIDNENPRYIIHTARVDSNIYSFYRNILMNKYEELLKKLNINECVIAYRKIPIRANSKKNKCSVHFANEAIEEIKRQVLSEKNSGCYAIALDIKGFFDNLSHGIIKQQWCKVIGSNNGLPQDHFKIYKNITKYRYIDVEKLENLLNINFEKIYQKNNKIRKQNENLKLGSNDPPSPNLKLCTDEDFRNIIIPNLEEKKQLGIPQGTPISDAIANMYMLNFDVAMQKLAIKNNGYYRRYSDDILLILPQCSVKRSIRIINWLLKYTTKTLKINAKKTVVSKFSKNDSSIVCNTYKLKNDIECEMVGKPFEYLGLSFDGKIIRLRKSTISAFYIKLSSRIKKEVKIAKFKLKKRGNKYPTASEIYKIISFDMIYNSYMECREPEEKFLGNFYTYVNLVSKVTSSLQIKDIFNNLENWIKKRAKKYCVDTEKKYRKLKSYHRNFPSTCTALEKA